MAHKSAKATLQSVYGALDEAHWLGGTPAQQIAQLIAEREAALEGRHPVQQERGVTVVPRMDFESLRTGEDVSVKRESASVKCYDTPTPNPALGAGEHEALRQRVLEARNLLNHALEDAARNGIEVEVRLIPCMNVGAARLGIHSHYEVEALPVRSKEDIEREERATLASLKFKYENPLGGALR